LPAGPQRDSELRECRRRRAELPFQGRAPATVPAAQSIQRSLFQCFVRTTLRLWVRVCCALYFTRYVFTFRLSCTNQSSFYCLPPPALPTLLQYHCLAIAQYTTPPLPPFSKPYTIQYSLCRYRVKAKLPRGSGFTRHLPTCTVFACHYWVCFVSLG